MKAADRFLTNPRPEERLDPRLRLEGPLVGREMLVRERLLEHLATRWRMPVTVVAAPAGYGKTTLLAQAMAANAAAPLGIDCWLPCGPEMTAVSALGEGLCRAVETPVPAGGLGTADLGRVVVEALWHRSPQEVVLMIDDVHEISPDSEAARLLESVVSSLPANGHVVLAGRASPPVSLARLEVEGRVLSIGQTELAFTGAEVADFARQRGVPDTTVEGCGGWPALAELFADAGSHVAREYVGQEVLSHLAPSRRRDLGLLAHLGSFDDDLASAVLGRDDVAGLLAGLPLVAREANGESRLHSLWQSLLAQDLTAAELAEGRRRAAAALQRRGLQARAVRLFMDAEAWEEAARTVVEALGVAHPPVARDVLAEWLAELPAEIRAQPAGRLLEAVVTAEGDAEDARQRFKDCRVAFRAQGQTAGEIACLVQMGQMAWMAEDTEGLATTASWAFELEAAGCEEAVPIACLGRALLYDIDNDSRRMLLELDRILPGSVNDAWWGIVSWARAIGLLELGHTSETVEAAEKALAHAQFLHAPLAQTTRLQALWYQGKTAEVLRALPEVLERIRTSGYRNHIALVASQCAIAHALHGLSGPAASYLAQAQAAAAMVADTPLVDTNLSVAEAAVALVEGNEAAAAATLTAHVTRHPVRQGISAAPQQRHLALFYVLVPETRPIWDAADLGPVWAAGRDLARAVVAVRQEGTLPPGTPPLDDAAVQAHLPPTWIAELGTAAVAAGREDSWQLLDRTWPSTHPAVAELARGPRGPRRDGAREAVARLAVPPTRQLELRLLGPIELREDDRLVQAADWRRERVRSLLAYLALHETVSRRQLASDLWPDLDPDALSPNLRVTLTYLLRVLEPERGRRDASFYLRQHGDNLSLHPGDWLTVDLWDFDREFRRATEADRQGQPAAALDHALQAVDRWRGDPTELISAPWAVTALEQRRLRLVTTAIRAGELLVARGDTDRALTLAQKALDIDPWIEAGHRLVVATHRARSDDLAARRALQHYREAIGDLGVGPDETTLMVERLLDSLPPRPGR